MPNENELKWLTPAERQAALEQEKHLVMPWVDTSWRVPQGQAGLQGFYYNVVGKASPYQGKLANAFGAYFDLYKMNLGHLAGLMTGQESPGSFGPYAMNFNYFGYNHPLLNFLTEMSMVKVPNLGDYTKFMGINAAASWTLNKSLESGKNAFRSIAPNYYEAFDYLFSKAYGKEKAYTGLDTGQRAWLYTNDPEFLSKTPVTVEQQRQRYFTGVATNAPHLVQEWQLGHGFIGMGLNAFSKMASFMMPMMLLSSYGSYMAGNFISNPITYIGNTPYATPLERLAAIQKTLAGGVRGALDKYGDNITHITLPGMMSSWTTLGGYKDVVHGYDEVMQLGMYGKALGRRFNNILFPYQVEGVKWNVSHMFIQPDMDVLARMRARGLTREADLAMSIYKHRARYTADLLTGRFGTHISDVMLLRGGGSYKVGNKTISASYNKEVLEHFFSDIGINPFATKPPSADDIYTAIVEKMHPVSMRVPFMPKDPMKANRMLDVLSGLNLKNLNQVKLRPDAGQTFISHMLSFPNASDWVFRTANARLAEQYGMDPAKEVFKGFFDLHSSGRRIFQQYAAINSIIPFAYTVFNRNLWLGRQLFENTKFPAIIGRGYSLLSERESVQDLPVYQRGYIPHYMNNKYGFNITGRMWVDPYIAAMNSVEQGQLPNNPLTLVGISGINPVYEAYLTAASGGGYVGSLPFPGLAAGTSYYKYLQYNQMRGSEKDRYSEMQRTAMMANQLDRAKRQASILIGPAMLKMGPHQTDMSMQLPGWQDNIRYSETPFIYNNTNLLNYFDFQKQTQRFQKFWGQIGIFDLNTNYGYGGGGGTGSDDNNNYGIAGLGLFGLGGVVSSDLKKYRRGLMGDAWTNRERYFADMFHGSDIISINDNLLPNPEELLRPRLIGYTLKKNGEITDREFTTVLFDKVLSKKVKYSKEKFEHIIEKLQAGKQSVISILNGKSDELSDWKHMRGLDNEGFTNTKLLKYLGIGSAIVLGGAYLYNRYTNNEDNDSQKYSSLGFAFGGILSDDVNKYFRIGRKGKTPAALTLLAGLLSEDDYFSHVDDRGYLHYGTAPRAYINPSGRGGWQVTVENKIIMSNASREAAESYATNYNSARFSEPSVLLESGFTGPTVRAIDTELARRTKLLPKQYNPPGVLLETVDEVVQPADRTMLADQMREAERQALKQAERDARHQARVERRAYRREQIKDFNQRYEWERKAYPAFAHKLRERFIAAHEFGLEDYKTKREMQYYRWRAYMFRSGAPMFNFFGEEAMEGFFNRDTGELANLRHNAPEPFYDKDFEKINFEGYKLGSVKLDINPNDVQYLEKAGYDIRRESFNGQLDMFFSRKYSLSHSFGSIARFGFRAVGAGALYSLDKALFGKFDENTPSLLRPAAVGIGTYGFLRAFGEEGFMGLRPVRTALAVYGAYRISKGLFSGTSNLVGNAKNMTASQFFRHYIDMSSDLGGMGALAGLAATDMLTNKLLERTIKNSIIKDIYGRNGMSIGMNRFLENYGGNKLLHLLTEEGAYEQGGTANKLLQMIEDLEQGRGKLPKGTYYSDAEEVIDNLRYKAKIGGKLEGEFIQSEAEKLLIKRLKEAIKDPNKLAEYFPKGIDAAKLNDIEMKLAAEADAAKQIALTGGKVGEIPAKFRLLKEGVLGAVMGIYSGMESYSAGMESGYTKEFSAFLGSLEVLNWMVPWEKAGAISNIAAKGGKIGKVAGFLDRYLGKTPFIRGAFGLAGTVISKIALGEVVKGAAVYLTPDEFKYGAGYRTNEHIPMEKMLRRQAEARYGSYFAQFVDPMMAREAMDELRAAQLGNRDVNPERMFDEGKMSLNFLKYGTPTMMMVGSDYRRRINQRVNESFELFKEEMLGLETTQGYTHRQLVGAGHYTNFWKSIVDNPDIPWELRQGKYAAKEYESARQQYMANNSGFWAGTKSFFRKLGIGIGGLAEEWNVAHGNEEIEYQKRHGGIDWAAKVYLGIGEIFNGKVWANAARNAINAKDENLQEIERKRDQALEFQKIAERTAKFDLERKRQFRQTVGRIFSHTNEMISVAPDFFSLSTYMRPIATMEAEDLTSDRPLDSDQMDIMWQGDSNHELRFKRETVGDITKRKAKEKYDSVMAKAKANEKLTNDEISIMLWGSEKQAVESNRKDTKNLRWSCDAWGYV